VYVPWEREAPCTVKLQPDAMNGERPKVSVLMLTYNNAKYVEEQIRSILEQTMNDWELIISDDASTDDTVSIVHRMSGDPRIRILQAKTNRGIIGNFTHAARYAQGEYLAPCDGDDVWLPEKLGLMAEYLDAHPRAQMTHHPSVVVDERLVPIKNNMPRSPSLGSVVTNEQRNLELRALLERNHIPAHTMMIRTEFYRKISESILFCGLLHDHWIALNAVTAGEVGYTAKGLVLYRQHSKNAIGGSTRGLGFYLQAMGSLSFAEVFLTSSSKYKAALEMLLSRTELQEQRRIIDRKLASLSNILSAAEASPGDAARAYLRAYFVALKRLSWKDVWVIGYLMISQIVRRRNLLVRNP
jgi:glycosyltransferase involved in cell wall biosynthesis